MKGWPLLIALLVVLGSSGCSAGAPQGPPPSAGTRGTSYPPDDRVSPHGKVRPTLTATTDEEPVHYYNPNTGTQSDYTLEIDRDAQGEIERINFPNEGWLEIDGNTVKNPDGSETYTRIDDGAEYTIGPKPDKTEDTEGDSGSGPTQ